MTTPLDPIPGPPAKAKGDLGTRTLSAIVMVAVAGTALWLGGWVFTAFVVAVGLGVLWEWWGLVRRIAKTPLGAALWMVGGLFYIGAACLALWLLRVGLYNVPSVAAAVIATVISVDVGAYFAGRTIGGPRIAPAISPSKTWAGLAGGAVAAATLTLLVAFNANYWVGDLTWPTGEDLTPIMWTSPNYAVLAGIGIAVLAQAGDFFESWMKRRAGVKDSGSLIPGHGGLFDRVDGMLPVSILFGVVACSMMQNLATGVP